jgi:hypothetical protein
MVALNLIIHARYAHLHVEGGKSTYLTNNGASMKSWDNLADNKNLKQFSYHSNQFHCEHPIKETQNTSRFNTKNGLSI